MSDEYEIDDERCCPKCNHSPIHFRDCQELTCENGEIDISEEDYLEPGTSFEICSECKGTGIETWCPNCGKNLSSYKWPEENNS